MQSLKQHEFPSIFNVPRSVGLIDIDLLLTGTQGPRQINIYLILKLYSLNSQLYPEPPVVKRLAYLVAPTTEKMA